MNIGILTFHRSRNYGAVLQAYGICEVLNKLGHDTEIIDYKCEVIEENLKLWVKDKNFLKTIFRAVFRYRKELAFKTFHNHFLKLSKKRNLSNANIKEVYDKYDILVVGSDQVWSKNITKEDDTYFLKNISNKKIAYAASMGDSILLSKQMIEDIRDFDSVSVRENKLNQELIANNIRSNVCCDPTILAGKEVYARIATGRLCKDKYVFVFMIWNSEELLNNAKQFADTNGLKLINCKNSLEFFMHCTPMDFISWIKNAEYVFTNSFHGTVFSLLFDKKFVSSICKVDGKMNTRILELLEYVNCQNHILRDESRLVREIESFDYMQVEEKLDELRKNSSEFLLNSISDIKKVMDDN